MFFFSNSCSLLHDQHGRQPEDSAVWTLDEQRRSGLASSLDSRLTNFCSKLGCGAPISVPPPSRWFDPYTLTLPAPNLRAWIAVAELLCDRTLQTLTLALGQGHRH